MLQRNDPGFGENGALGLRPSPTVCHSLFARKMRAEMNASQR